MIFHENRLLADDSHVTSYFIFVKNWEKCRCSRDWRFKGYYAISIRKVQTESQREIIVSLTGYKLRLWHVNDLGRKEIIIKL